MHRLTRPASGKGGFTLIEMLIVIAIIGILAMIAVPIYLGQRTKAMRSEAMTNLDALRLFEEQYYAEYADYAPADASSTLGTCGANHPENIATIQGEIPAFRPGTGENLLFSYCIYKNKAISTADYVTLLANTPCFTAEAYGNTGTGVEGMSMRIDCNNVKNY